MDSLKSVRHCSIYLFVTGDPFARIPADLHNLSCKWLRLRVTHVVSQCRGCSVAAVGGEERGRARERERDSERATTWGCTCSHDWPAAFHSLLSWTPTWLPLPRPRPRPLPASIVHRLVSLVPATRSQRPVAAATRLRRRLWFGQLLGQRSTHCAACQMAKAAVANPLRINQNTPLP